MLKHLFKKRKINSTEEGITLIELIVAVAIFSTVVLSMTAIAISVIKSQRKSFITQNTQEAGRYLLETMIKEIRMGTINSAAGDGLTVLNITNADDITLDYQFDNSNKQLLRQNQLISPTNISLTGSFYLQKSSIPDRALVTIVMQISALGGRPEERSDIFLQSTITSRSY